MTNQELQEAIDKARAWIAPQVNHTTTPSHELKEATIAHIKELQKIQAIRAAAVVDLGSTEPKAGITAVAGACSMCHGSGFGLNGQPCTTCKKMTFFTDRISTGTGSY